MQELTLSEFAAADSAFDALVEKRTDIDHFCSRSDWILPANASLMPKRSSFIHRSENGFAALMRGRHQEGWTYVQPLEALWCFACPLAGTSEEALAADFASLCWAKRNNWDVLMLGGLRRDSPLFCAAVAALSRRLRLHLGPVTARLCADLSDGPEAFLLRRSRNFRRSLDRAKRRADAAGITLVAVHAAEKEDTEALYGRIQHVEARSWKGAQRVGINVGGMRGFYAQMLPRLAARNALRLVFAQDDGKDVAYIVGGICGRTYRGLQLSFDHSYERFSLGNILQLAQMQHLHNEGVTHYDLGQEVAYKRRWADSTEETVTLLAWQ